MSFQSSGFFIFTVVLWLCAWGICKTGTSRKIVLLLGSYYFYMTFDWRFGLPLLGLSIFYYLAARVLGLPLQDRAKKWVLAGAVAVPLGVLAYFKYMSFFVAELAALFDVLGLHVGVLQVVAPVGISFFTFQGLAYVIDVHRGRFSAHRNPLDVLLFLSFFPSLLSGPINRAGDLLPQISKGGALSTERTAEGFFLIARGFVKKIVFADLFAVHVVDPAFANPSDFSTLFLVLAVYAYTLQIYMDLSGYTDIARGVAKVFGFDLMENFRMPYAALTVSQFWQRWHISMSSFFRDYLFHGLGGSRYGNVYFNLLVTFIAIGIWHGAGWNFVLYGVLHGSVVAAERYIRLRNERLGRTADQLSWVRVGLKWAFVFNFVSFSRILFRADGIAEARAFVEAMFANVAVGPFDLPLLVALLMGAALALHFVPARFDGRLVHAVHRLPSVVSGGVFAATFYLLLMLSAGGSGFIYFAF